MKEAIRVALDGVYIEPVIVPNEQVGVIDEYELIEASEELELVGHTVCDRVPEGIYIPKWDFDNLIWIEGKDQAGMLDNYKERKIAELSNICMTEILSDFESLALGYSQHYGFDAIDQTNIHSISLDLLLHPQIEEVYWKTRESITLVPHTREQFLQVVADAAIHQKTHQYKYLNLKMQILSATTKEEIDALNWD